MNKIDTVVIFTKNNARIIKVEDSSPYKSLPNAIINPDFSKVIGIAPHHWSIVEGQLVPLRGISKLERDQDIEKAGADNDISSFIKKPILSKKTKIYILLGICIAIIYLAGALTSYILIKQ